MNIQKYIGLALMILGTFLITALLFFYTVILFSEKWPGLTPMYDMFRMLFSVTEGIIVMYAFFIAIALPLVGLVLYGAHLMTNKKYATKKQMFVLSFLWVCAVSIGLALTITETKEAISRFLPFSQNPVTFDVSTEIPLSVLYAFKTTLKNEVQTTQGVPIEGFEPAMFLKAFPGLTDTDFEGVEASIGYYTIEGGKLVHKIDDSKLIHSAAKAVTDRGLDTLLSNVAVRLNVDLTKEGTLTEIIEALVRYTQKEVEEEHSELPTIPKDNAPLPPSDTVMCTMDAKICPDGSYVGRTAPSCAFAPCPVVTSNPEEHVCTVAEKEAKACTREYAPVCGHVIVQCITAPCPPIPQTFSNGCTACSAGNVDFYTQGACEAE
jgi:hypothetical protein